MKQSAVIRYLRSLPIDIGQGEYQRVTGGKYLAWQKVPRPVFGAQAVDLGCGDGYWSERLKAFGYQVTSFDQPRDYPNQDSAGPYSDMIINDLNNVLPLPDRSIDLVWCSEVIEHLNNPQQLIGEIKRILKSGGKALITTPNSFFWLSWLFRLLGQKPAQWQNAGHRQFFSYADVRQLFPLATIGGYFPYWGVKRWLRRPWAISWLSPTFVIVITAA